MNRVGITGYGVKCALGKSVPEFSRRMFAGESGIRDLRGTALPDPFPVTAAGVVENEAISGELTRDWERYCAKVLENDLDIVRQAIAGARTDLPFDSIVYGTIPAFHLESVIGILRHPELLLNAEFGSGSVAETYCHHLAAEIQRAGLGRIPIENRICINTACISGVNSLGLAFENIRFGYWKRCLVISTDWRPLESGIMGFHMINAMSTSKEPAETISRPFCRTRSGVIRSQGGAAMVLENLDGARSSGSAVFAEILGFGQTTDAYRLTDGREDGAGIRRAMQEAVESASLDPSEIDYINAHGTATKLNDRLETRAIKDYFGELAAKIPVSSLKSQLGHAIAGAGLVESLACVLMLEKQMIAPTINYREKDPECDLDYVPNVARPARLRRILKNSMAFGGQNACLVLSEPA